MPLTDRGQAKDSGFAQVRASLQSFEGDVISAEWGQWGGTLIDDEGNPVPPKEFLEVVNANVKVLTVSEELSMPIEDWTFRVNCSDYKGSFWVEDFLASADAVKLLIPDELVGKRITWKKVVRTYNIRDKEVSTSNFVIEGVGVLGVAGVSQKVSTPSPNISSPTKNPVIDPMEIALELAVGKTETQFRSAISLHPGFVGNPLLPLAKAGAITAALVKEGRLVEIQEGGKTIYRKP